MIKKDYNLSKMVNTWLSSHSRFIKESTISNYTNIVDNHILKDFTHESFLSLNNQSLQDYIIIKCTHISKTGNKLSVKTVKDIMVVLKLILRYAFSKGLIEPFDLSLKYPKIIYNKKPEIIGKKHIKRIIQTVYESNDKRCIGILIALFSGMRIGEICALKYSDICFKSETISVKRTLQRISNKRSKTRIIETLPKTSSSIRTIPLSKEISNIIDNKNKNTDLYILSGTRFPVEPRLLRNIFNRILKSKRMRHYKFHSLRHTFATKCIELNIDYKTISTLLGHSNINTTLNLYVHPNSYEKKKAIKKLTASFIT